MADRFASGDNCLNEIIDSTLKEMNDEDIKTVLMRYNYWPVKPLLNFERLEKESQDKVNRVQFEL